MDINNILTQLHEERRRVNEVILILERLAEGMVRRNRMPSVASLRALEGGIAKRTVSAETRAKMARAQRRRWAAAKKTSAGD